MFCVVPKKLFSLSLKIILCCFNLQIYASSANTTFVPNSIPSSEENFCIFSLQDVINENDLQFNIESADYCKSVLNTSLEPTIENWLWILMIVITNEHNQ